MRNKSNLMKSQSGQILAYTIIIIMLAGLIIAPLLSFTYGSWRAVNIRQERTQELYASDTGIEDALYQIKTEKEGTGVGNLGFGETYDAGTPNTNDRDVNVTVEKIWLPQDLPGTSETEAPTAGTDKSNKLVTVGMLSSVQATAASDDFSSGWPNSGTGNWTGSWNTAGDVTIGSGSEGCDSGNCLKLADVPGTATRTANLLKYMQPQLKFTARALSLEAGDTIDLNVTFGNSTPETVWSWADGSETSDCTAYDFDLYDLYGWQTDAASVPLQIQFDANLSIQNLAQDDFSSGNWAGGSGWWPSSSWTASGSGASVVNTGSSHSDTYHVKLSSSGYVMRRVNLSSVANPQITVWAKTNGFGASDRVYLKVSTRTSPSPTTPSDWSAALLTWSSSSSSSYTAYGYDLSAYAGQNIWVLFSGSMDSTGATVASDGFESGGWDGNPSQWTAAWAHSSSNSYVQTSGSPRSGSYHLALRQTGYAERVIDLSSYTQRQLRYYYKMSNNWEGSDHGYLKIYLNGSLYDTIDLTQRTSYSSSASTYNLPQGQVKIRFETLTNNDNEYLYVDDISILGDPPCFYFDDVSITEGDSFYADNIWIGSEYNVNTIEIAYIDPTFGDAYLDRIGVWMPAGCHYVEVVGNETTVELNQEPTTILADTYAGGTILEWDYGDVALHLPSGQIPIVKTLTFAYSVDVTQSVEGMFVWIAADAVDNGPPSLSDTQDDYISWDKGYEIYKAVSQAYSDIYGSNTQVTAYVAQGEVNKQNAVSYGDYVATGNPLLIDYAGSSAVKEKVIDPTDSGTWVTKSGFYYDGRAEVPSVGSLPDDAQVISAWLYWSAFIEDYDPTHRVTDWESFGSQPDTVVDFMYPKRYGPETFSVAAGNGSESYTTLAYTNSVEPYKESIDLLAGEPALTLSPIRYWSENLGTAVSGNGDDSFLTAHRPISSAPAPRVWVNSVLRTEGTDYVINYPSGNVTITRDTLSGPVVIDYSVDGLLTLVKGTDYTINQIVVGGETRYTGFTVINDNLVGTVTVNSYWAKHWQLNLQHAAYDRYGTALAPMVEEVVPPGGHVGYSYDCFRDVTSLLGVAAGSGGKHPGKGQYAVGNIKSTPGVDGSAWDTRSFSGWSLIIVYQSETETAHQFYLYDPIHNNDRDGTLEDGECPFQVRPTTDYSPQPSYIYVPFTLTDFYPPEGTVDGRVTYFVGEGDTTYTGDSIGFKGASQPSYTTLFGPNNPATDVMNTVSTTGEKGIDIDTYDITGEVGSDHAANVRLQTDGDRWYMVYMILSFKTNQVPKSDFAFNVASVTYQYELNQ